jgi:hypothetical protein
MENFLTGSYIATDTEKWEVIDRTGNVIVPFICNRVKAISENKGIVFVFSTSYSLNTGIPKQNVTKLQCKNQSPLAYP